MTPPPAIPPAKETGFFIGDSTVKKEAKNQLLQNIKDKMKSYDPPSQADLEKSVEENTKCGKCDGPVRAVCDDAQPADSFTLADLEIRTIIYCRDARCGKTEVQWRPWMRGQPKEL